MKLHRNYNKWTEWQKVAYQHHNERALAEMVLIADAYIGKNYVFLIDHENPKLQNHGMMRLYLNGHCFQYGGEREYGLKRFNQFVQDIKSNTLRVPYDVPLYEV